METGGPEQVWQQGSHCDRHPLFRYDLIIEPMGFKEFSTNHSYAAVNGQVASENFEMVS